MNAYWGEHLLVSTLALAAWAMVDAVDIRFVWSVLSKSVKLSHSLLGGVLAQRHVGCWHSLTDDSGRCVEVGESDKTRQALGISGEKTYWVEKFNALFIESLWAS